MYEALLEKLNIIKKLNTEDSDLIIRLCNSYLKDRKSYSEMREKTSILNSNSITCLDSNIIDLDTIWVAPYFHTRMKYKISKIVDLISNTNIDDILNSPHKFLHKAIYLKPKREFFNPIDQIDIVDFIKNLDKEKKLNLNKEFNFTFIAKEINEEALFKENQLKEAFNIINITNSKERNKKIYNNIYNYLQKDFISNCYCNFCNNKCVLQRHLFRTYPITRKNGCCYTNFGHCSHLKSGKCDAKCLACTLYSCKYLTKRGIGYWATEFILLKAFFNKKQCHHLVFDFFKTEDEILNNIIKCQDL